MSARMSAHELHQTYFLPKNYTFNLLSTNTTTFLHCLYSSAIKPLSLPLSVLGAGEAVAGERCPVEDHLRWREGWGHHGQRARSNGGVEGAAELLWGQSRPGHFGNRQGAVLLSGAWKPDVDGRHHGPDRMGWAQVRYLPYLVLVVHLFYSCVRLYRVYGSGLVAAFYGSVFS